MKDQMATKITLVIGLLTTLAFLSLIGVSSEAEHSAAQSNSAQNTEANERIALRDALRRGGLREAAKLKGHYVRNFDPHWDFGRFDVEALTRNSAVVIIGFPTAVRGGRLAGEGQLILTDYEVAIQEVIKGEVKLGETVTVSLVGGRVDFEDGTSAEVKTSEFEHIKTGRSYIFFLSEGEDNSEAYSLTGGPQGLVEIVDSTNIKSHGRPTDPIAEESKKMTKESFLKEVRKQGKQWPHPGKCCS